MTEERPDADFDTHDALLRDAVRTQAHGGGAPWYRRRAALVAAGVAAVVAVTVLTDLPAPASRASEIAAATTVVRDVNTDLSPCDYAVTEAVTLYKLQAAGALTASEHGQAPKLLSDDQIACSLVNSSVFDVSNIDIPGGDVGHPLTQLVSTSTSWAIQDALDTIVSVQALVANPSDAHARRTLRAGLASLAADRAAANGSLARADAILHAKLVALSLPQVGAGVVVP